MRKAIWKKCLVALILVLGFLPGAGVRAHAADDGPPGGAAQWHTILDDEFNGNGLDATNWHNCFEPSNLLASGLCKGSNGFGALEADVAGAVSVHDGSLWLEAQKQQVQTPDGETRQYTSGLLSTSGLFSFKYGYMELRFRIPAGKGLWPGFYTVYADQNIVYPEVDVMEIRGQYPNVLWMTNHFIDQFGFDESDYSTYDATNYSTGFHTIGVDWEPNSLTWYVDGVARKTISDASEIPNMNMILRLSLEVGGDWNGPPDANTPFPSSLAVDWIRVWQHGATPAATPTSAPIVTPTVAPISRHVRSTTLWDPIYTWLLIIPGVALIALLAVLGFLRRRRLAMGANLSATTPRMPAVDFSPHPSDRDH
jgi:beta-glucanase (GH16 family)